MKKMSLQSFVLFSFFFLLSQIHFGQGMNPHQIDSLVEKTMKTFNVPGMAVAILKDGKVVHMKGYGTRSIDKGGKVDENTMFGVASNTKAMTTAALAKLIDQGKLEWDTKVTAVIPEFKLYDPYVTSEFTVRDLLTHRSGLGLGAGDLMVWPSANITTKDELIHNLRYLKPVSSFRSKYDYDNLLYIVAGVVVEKVSGVDYDTFIAENIFKPLEMENTVVNWNLIKDNTNVIEGHAPNDGKLVTVGLSFTKAADPAAGVYSSVNDMGKWVQMQLNKGKYGENLQDSIFSQKQHREMWTPQTLIRTGPGDYNTQFRAYGLGWNLSDVNGYKEVAHTGGLLGIVSQVTMIPQLDLGIIVLTNQQSGEAFRSVSNSIKDSYFGIKGKDRIKQYNEIVLRNEKHSDSIVSEVWENVEKTQKNGKTNSAGLANYTGTYSDPWFGRVNIFLKNGKWRFEAEKAPDLLGEMRFYK